MVVIVMIDKYFKLLLKLCVHNRLTISTQLTLDSLVRDRESENSLLANLIRDRSISFNK